MNQLVKHLLWTTAITPVLLSQSVSAHVIWFEQINPTRSEIFFGHPEEGTSEPFDVNKFTGATAYDVSGNVIPSTTAFTNGRFFVDTLVPAAAYSGSYDNGFWRENPDGSYDNITAEEAAEIGFANTGQYLKYATGIFNQDFPISRSFGQPLEIRPQSSPFNLTAGDTLPVRVFFQQLLTY